MERQTGIEMTVDDFLVWAEEQPGRFELVAGQVHAKSPERIRHTETKGLVFLALRAAVQRAGSPCDVFGNGATVRVDSMTAFEPDALVRCGPSLDADAIETPDPLVVVEVLSPSTRHLDTGAKLAGYFAAPSIHHYLIVDPDRRVVIHHRRDGPNIATQILGAGPFRLDPPGLELMAEDLLSEG